MKLSRHIGGASQRRDASGVARGAWEGARFPIKPPTGLTNRKRVAPRALSPRTSHAPKVYISVTSIERDGALS
eukprot:360271-Prymnesium_polylepis.1